MYTFLESLQKYEKTYGMFEEWLEDYLTSEKGNHLWSHYDDNDENSVSSYQIVTKFPFALQLGLALEFLENEGHFDGKFMTINSMEDFKVLINNVFNRLENESK